MILIDPGATRRQLGYILPEECPFKQAHTSTAAAAAADAAAAVVVAWEKKKREKEPNKVQMEAHSEGVS